MAKRTSTFCFCSGLFLLFCCFFVGAGGGDISLIFNYLGCHEFANSLYDVGENAYRIVLYRVYIFGTDRNICITDTLP
jgi:hypothetical protein